MDLRDRNQDFGDKLMECFVKVFLVIVCQIISTRFRSIITGKTLIFTMLQRIFYVSQRNKRLQLLAVCFVEPSDRVARVYGR
jgi:hypothetical protein